MKNGAVQDINTMTTRDVYSRPSYSMLHAQGTS